MLSSKTTGELCQNIEYKTVRGIPASGDIVRYTVTSDERKQESLLQLNRRLQGNYPVNCQCPNCRTDVFTVKR